MLSIKLLIVLTCFFLGSKKVYRASHPYLHRPKNSSPLSQANSLINNTTQTLPSVYPPPQMDLLDLNLTESQGNVTQPQWDQGPWRGHDGYVGSNDHFKVKYNIIKIKNTDAVIDNLPSEELRERKYDDEGGFSYYEEQRLRDDVYQLWMNKIGPYLADWVLNLPRRGAFFCFPTAYFFACLC